MSIQTDVEELAELLCRLKDRTDRSYASLARRLGMNTSTLHRYCAGEVVPQDFAPVERLAAFCGATAEERLELHRLWLSAAAARQRAPTTGSAGAVASAPAPALTPDRDPAAVPDPDPVPHPDGTLLADRSIPEQLGDDPDPDEPAAAPAPAPRFRYRHRLALACTAVTCASLATVGITFAVSHGSSFGADSSGSTVSRSASPVASERAGTTSAPSESSSTSEPSGPHQRAAPSAAEPSASAANPTTGLPLTWSADSQVWDMGCSHDYVIAKSPGHVPPPPVQQDAGVWVATQGAVHGRQTMVQISVQGRSSTAVVLKALRVRVVSRGTPAAGSAYAMDQGCGSELTSRRFTVNLDVDRPIVHRGTGADSKPTKPAVHFPFRVSAEDPEVLVVDATTRTYDARWYLELDWSSQGRNGTIRVDDHGRPFRTTGIKGMPRYWYGTNEAGSRAWVPYEG